MRKAKLAAKIKSYTEDNLLDEDVINNSVANHFTKWLIGTKIEKEQFNIKTHNVPKSTNQRVRRATLKSIGEDSRKSKSSTPND